MSTVCLVEDLNDGTVYSSSVPWQAGTFNVTATGIMSDADGLNNQNSAAFSIEVSFDGGQSFAFAAGLSSWMGGTNPLTNGPNLPKISVGYSASQQTPTHVRVRFDLPKPLSCGAQVAFS